MATSALPTIPAAPSPAVPASTMRPAPTNTIAPVFSETPSSGQICSPLAGYSLTDLPGMIVNPYHPPKPGSDDPHQGVDLAVLDGTKQFAVPGNPVQAVLAGKVAGITNDRFPYGNLIIIETPLDNTNLPLASQLALPTPFAQRLPAGALTCPDLTESPAAAGESRSLYLLYGHMLNSPAVEVGDAVVCGQSIGAVGQSGNALNPHLHLEIRVGPAGQTFPSMAHYDASAKDSEIAAYCLWRVSGVYQTIDPGCLWGSCPTP